MFTKWSDIESWIRDNNFVHWVFTKSRPADRDDKVNDKIVDSNYFTGDFEDKLAMTRKYLLLNGGRAYGVAWDKPNNTYNGAVCEVWLEAEPKAAPTEGVGAGLDMEQMKESIRKELQAEWDKREYERKAAELEKERKEFEADKNSAIGLLTNYLAPVAKALVNRKIVAGTDTSEQLETDPIPPIKAKTQQEPSGEQEENVFTEEEEDELYTLLKEFKEIEPQYLELIRGVVKLAKSGSPMYAGAKDFILKNV